MEKFIEFLEENNARENYNRDVKGYKKLCERDIPVGIHERGVRLLV